MRVEEERIYKINGTKEYFYDKTEAYLYLAASVMIDSYKDYLFDECNKPDPIIQVRLARYLRWLDSKGH